MHRKTVTMIGAAAALAAGPGLAGPANAAPPAVPVATSYAELLQPIPNAVERLKASDAEAASRPARLIDAQYGPFNRHHHHHHHHHHDRGWYLRNGYYWYGGAWTLRPRHHHHHHHHNHY
ncbi:MAG TPA: hypothetical protein VHZ26_11970 [Caulobacteraceae bacterium]|jgi:hypothetical protein|nr:hypothetical protein [Caulobacteraceae bacterium]